MKRFFRRMMICRIILLGAAAVVAPLAKAEEVADEDPEIAAISALTISPPSALT
jgi:hypothetical protein